MSVQHEITEGDNDSLKKFFRIAEAYADGPVWEGNAVELLIDGPATYARMLEEIEQAKKFIRLEVFNFSDDDVGQKFAKALKSQSENGVSVHVIYDCVGSLTSSESIFSEMRDAGVKVRSYNEIDPTIGGNPLNANVRNHRKLMVVDGKIAFTGGINICSRYQSSSSTGISKDRLKEGWRDTHVAITGPAVGDFLKAFNESWLEAGGKSEECFNQALEFNRTGNIHVAKLIAEGGNSAKSPIYKAYCLAIGAAQAHIYISQAYFVPDRPFIRQLVKAARRGVDVKILVPGFSDSSLVLNASRFRYGRLLRNNVRIYETTSAFIHAKTAVIDGQWSTVGSSNLDNRSIVHNYEINAVMLGKEFGQQMIDQFQIDIANAREIELSEWKKRSLLERIKQYVSSLLDYWI